MGNLLVLGAGSCRGLGAAYRLKELGYGDWEIYERNADIGGLSPTFKDYRGFTIYYFQACFDPQEFQNLLEFVLHLYRK